MRRHRRFPRYWVLLQLWWLGLRRPARLAVSMSLATLVLCMAMPLTAAVGNGTDPAEPNVAGAETSPAEHSAGADSTEWPTGEPGDQATTGEQESAGSEGDAEVAQDNGDDVSIDPGDGAPENEEESDVAGDVGEEGLGHGDASAGEATDLSRDGAGSDDEPESDLSMDDGEEVDGDEDGSTSEGAAEDVAATDVELSTDEGVSPGATDDVELELDAAEDVRVDGLGGIGEEANEALVEQDSVRVADPSTETETPEEATVVEEIGAYFLTSMLSTYTVDEDLPAPARAPQISEDFAERLTEAADAYGADWALMLSVTRALDYGGAEPANARLLDLLGRKLAGVKPTASVDVLLENLTLVRADAEEAVALARYHRAVGIDGLSLGLDGARSVLAERVLAHPEIRLSQEGRADVEGGLTGVRVLVVLLYLAERHDDVVVSSLRTGHRLFARPGRISAHIYGQAVDIAALDGLSVLGNQGPGSLTEIAVKDLLALPKSLYPKQIISLHDMGGPSFAEPREHHNHIHIGF